MYIAVISKSDATGGGASRIAAGLTQLLNNSQEFEAHHWVGRPGVNADWYTFKLHGGQWLSLLQGAFAMFSRVIGLPDFLTPELLIHLLRKRTSYSLYHFHDISFTFSPVSLKWLAKRKPAIWTFHDCSPFTGGCIAPMNCNALYSGCKHCPQLDKLPLGTSIDLTGYMQRYKLNLLNQLPVIPIMPSRWLAEQAKRIVNFKVEPVIIPNYVDLDIYKPLDKHTVRSILGVPPERFIVLLSATSLSDYHKGNHLAVNALKKSGINPFIIAVGKLEQHHKLFFQGLDVIVTGYIYNDQLLAQYYAAANIFLYPTLADSFGCVAIETMACGTPAIAFATGGVPEVIEHNKTGWLVKTGDVQGLVDGLHYVVNNPKLLEAWRTAGLQKVKARYTKELFLAAHLKIYQQVLNNTYADL
jgi:glycosyltransferase involved in cell wall biosynthesis